MQTYACSLPVNDKYSITSDKCHTASDKCDGAGVACLRIGLLSLTLMNKTLLPGAARRAALLLFLLGCPVASALAQTWQWATGTVVNPDPAQAGYSNGYAALALDAAGNTYVTGRFSGTITLGSFTLTSGPGVDLFLARINPAGTFTMATRATGPVLITPRALAVAPDGTVVVAGGFSLAADFGPAGVVTSVGGTDIFVARFNPTTGAWTNVARAGGPSNDGVQALAVAPDGTVSTTGGANPDCLFGALPPLPNQGSSDIFVAQLNAAGTWLRATSGGGPGFDYGTAIAVGASGEVVVAGNLASDTATFGALPTLMAGGGQDALVARFSPTTGAWTQAVAGGGAFNENAAGVALTPNGEAVLVGNFNTFTQFGGLPAMPASGSDDMYVARLSAAGFWTQAVHTGDMDAVYAAAVHVEADGTATVAGTFFGTTAFGALPALVSAGQGDVFVARLGPAGTWQQALAGGGIGDENATALVLRGSTATVAGPFTSSATFGSHGVAGGSSTDTFVARFAGYPDLIVSTSLPGGGGEYNNVTITSTGAYYLTSDLIVHGTMVVQGGGSLATSNGAGCTIITGPGSFRLEDRAIFGICSPQGITTAGPTGSVQVLGSRYYDGGATYVYNGPTAQVTGNGLPAVTRNVTAGSGAPGLSLSQGLTMTELLYASSDVQLAGQPLVLRSDASGTAVVTNANGGRVLGNTATVQRFITNSYLGVGYRHYAPPVFGMTVGGLATAGFAPEVRQAAAYNASLTPGLISPFPTVYRYNESRVTNNAITGFSVFDRGWEVPASLSAPLAVGTGYTVHLPGTARVGFTGTLVEGIVQVFLPRSTHPDGGWFLVGNPYPSPLAVNTFTQAPVLFPTFENLGAAIYQFRATGPYAGTYQARVAGLGGSPTIPTGQAFFVRSSSGPGGAPSRVIFTNANRVTAFDANDNYFQRSAADPRPRLTLSLRDAADHADPAIVYFDAAATATFDPALDAAKLRNPGGQLNLSTVLGSERYAINGLPSPATAGRTLPLALDVPAAGAYTLALDELLNFAPGQALYLTDALTGTRHDLRRTARYAFNVAAAGEVPGRFALVFGAAGALATGTPSLNQSVTLSPNPAHGSVTLQAPAGIALGTVRIVNVLGRTVRLVELPAAAGAATLDLRGMPAGVYVVRSGSMNARLVVE